MTPPPEGRTGKNTPGLFRVPIEEIRKDVDNLRKSLALGTDSSVPLL